MQALKDKIVKDGLALGTEIIKVDSFLNHRIDTAFLLELGKEFQRRFADAAPDKILTMESSGIAVAFATAMAFGNLPVVFAKKAAPNTMVEDFYCEPVKSFTKGTVSSAIVAQKFLQAGERVLIIDDFLAHGEAATGLINIVRKAGAEAVGLGAVIEKAFQGGGEKVRAMGCRLESLAIVEEIHDGKIRFGSRVE